MKLRKTLLIGNEPVQLVSEDVRLEESAPGRACFRVKASAPLKGVVQLNLGYSAQDTDQVFFVGYVESSHTVDSVQQRIMCREVSHVLAKQLPLSLRHPTLQDVLEKYSDLTGLAFTAPDKAYTRTPAPHFQTLGSGIHGMNSLGDVFQIPEYIWQQQGDGSVFVGSWHDSRWATRPLDIDETFFTGVGANGGKILPALPPLRPGVMLNGKRVKKLQLKAHEMVVTW